MTLRGDLYEIQVGPINTQYLRSSFGTQNTVGTYDTTQTDKVRDVTVKDHSVTKEYTSYYYKFQYTRQWCKVG